MTTESYGLRPETRRRPLSGPAEILRCPECGQVVTGLPNVLQLWWAGPAPPTSARARSTRAPAGQLTTAACTAGMRRVMAREHTSLLAADTRLQYENEFKNSETTPGPQRAGGHAHAGNGHRHSATSPP
ncbi:hypothetical protein QJS66_14055 [Kocuria rhizophila]|nr:hypothetical protein QJS66_14055 [Kocuria rhizophila]